MYSASLSAALDRIAERADDVRRAFVPGAVPSHDDVETPAPASDFTLDPLSVAPPADAYFVVAGRGGAPAYASGGRFHVRDGALVDDAGRAVLGTSAAGGALRELCIDPVDAALGRAGDARIEPDGTLAYTRAAIDPRTGARESQTVIAGRVALARFPAATKLADAGGAAFSAPTGVVPHVGHPGDGSFAALLPMHRARSRIDIDAGLARLKDAYVAFDALQAAEAAKGRLGKTAMDLLK